MDLKYDIQNENLRRFFDERVVTMTNDQRAKIPTDLLVKIFTQGGKVTTKKITFMQQLYVLTQAGLADIYILIDDPERGIGAVQLEKLKKQKKMQRVDVTEANEYLNCGTFVLSGKDLTSWINHINGVSLSGAMNYVLKLKKTAQPRIPDYEFQFRFVMDMFLKYEGNKRKIIRYEQIKMTEWYILMYHSDDVAKPAAPLYERVLRDAVNCSRAQVMKSYKKLKNLGYIETYGKTKSATHRITVAGKNVLLDVLKKYVIP